MMNNKSREEERRREARYIEGREVDSYKNTKRIKKTTEKHKKHTSEEENDAHKKVKKSEPFAWLFFFCCWLVGGRLHSSPKKISPFPCALCALLWLIHVHLAAASLPVRTSYLIIDEAAHTESEMKPKFHLQAMMSQIALVFLLWSSREDPGNMRRRNSKERWSIRVVRLLTAVEPTLFLLHASFSQFCFLQGIRRAVKR